MDEIINKVAESGLLTIDLEEFYPEGEIKSFDMKDHLFMGLILKEKEFRQSLKDLDWGSYEDKLVNITCSADAIIPMWAYMLAATYLEPLARRIIFGTEKELVNTLLREKLSELDVNEYLDKRVVIKGCGDKQVSEGAYVEITRLLRPVVKSIMYGEACSTVPIYKQKAQ